MAKRRYTPEQIIVKLREAAVLESRGSTQAEAAKQIGVCEQRLIRWKKEYGGLRVDQAKRLKELEKENNRRQKLESGTCPSLHKSLKTTPTVWTFCHIVNIISAGNRRL